MRRLVPLTLCCVLLFAGQAVSVTTSTVVDAVGTSGWNPSRAAIKVGDGINWMNSTGFSHNVCVAPVGQPASACSSSSNEFRSDDPKSPWPGGGYSHTFASSGVFSYLCQQHPSMVGTVVVGGISGRALTGGTPLQGATVELKSGDTIVDSRTTDSGGNYVFGDPASGDYTLLFIPPTGFHDTSPANPISVTGYTQSSTVSADNNFSAVRTITGNVHDDSNGNGSADTGEGGVPNVVVFVDRNGDGVAQSGEQQTTTDTNGAYTLDGVPAGTQHVAVTVPSGYAATAATGRDVAPGGEAGVDFFMHQAPASTTTPPETPPDNGTTNVDLLGNGPATNGDDLLNGTGGPDTIFGLGGDDLILGLGGNDSLHGGPGDDSLDGGAGNDKLFGDAGNDRLTGGPGNDKLFGGAGSDRLRGGPGKDALNGGKGKDFYFGGSGNDTINSRDGIAETVDCGPGKDTVTADKKDRLKHCEKVSRR